MTARSGRRLVALVGLSGVGKTTLMRLVAERLPRTCRIVRTIMSREPRDEWERETFDFLDAYQIRVLHESGHLVHYEVYASKVYALIRTNAESATDRHLGLICLTEEGVRQLRAAGYKVNVVHVTSDRPPSGRGDKHRVSADQQRADQKVEADLQLFNQWGLEGLQAAEDRLAEYIQELRRQR
jgi:guanylate kinase